jgi:hypothetical protein
MANKAVKPEFSEAQKAFIRSEATIVALIGPFGEGKTYAGFWGLANHAQKFVDRPMYGAIIRDTFENLKNQTSKSINEASMGYVRWSDGGKKMRFGNAEIDLYGIDDMASLSKLQGAEYSFIWLEEPAPIAAKENAGLREEVFQTALTRVGRQKDAIPRLQITMNPADEDHWTYKRLIFDPINSMGVTTEVFNIPYGSNWVLKDEQRELVKQSYKDSPDLYERYVRGNFSFIQFGEAVTPEYNEHIHRSEEIFTPDPAKEVFRFWDGGLNPTCVFMQVSPRGRMLFMDTLRGENMGVKQLIETRIIPLINERYRECKKWRDIGDPSMVQREQSDSSQTAADVINSALGAAFEPGEKSWQNRREAMKEMFNRIIDGVPMFQLSRHDSVLHRCFRGGWHYSKDPSGRVMRDRPVKDLHSHPGDAVSHGIARILLRPRMLDRLARIKEITKAKWGITGVSDVYREKPNRIYIK